MTQTATKSREANMVKLTEIKCDPSKNPRGEIAPEDNAELTASVRENGVVQPVICIEGEEGLELVAGFRRYAACEAAGVDEIPVHIREPKQREVDSIIENLPGLRQDMTPIAEARAMKRLAQAEHLNQKQLAKRLGKSPGFVAERLRLLRLPEVVQEVFMTGRPGISVAPALEKIAKVSEPAAARVATLAAEDPELERRLRDATPSRVIERLMKVLAEERGTVKCADGQKRPRPPAEGELVAVSLGGYHRGIDLDELALSDERRDELGQRMEALAEGDARIVAEGDCLEFGLEGDDVDALRALGVLLEYGDDDDFYYGSARYCFDSVVLVDRLEALLTRAEADAKAREAEEIKAAEAEAKAGGKKLPKGVDPAQLRAEKAKEKRAKELADAKEAKKEARRLNLDLGRKLLKRRSRKRTEKRRRELVRGLALMAVMADEHLAGLGPRLVYETWQKVDNHKLKNGKTKEKVTYLEPREATERLLKNLEEAKTEDDILDLIGDALIAAVYASEEELPMSRRVCGYSGSLRFGSRGSVRRIIDDEASGVLPPELREELRRSKRGGYADLTRGIG